MLALPSRANQPFDPAVILGRRPAPAPLPAPAPAPQPPAPEPVVQTAPTSKKRKSPGSSRKLPIPAAGLAMVPPHSLQNPNPVMLASGFTTIERPAKKTKISGYVYKCRHCQHTLADPAALRQHSEKVHNLFDEGRLYEKCGLCGKGFHSKRDWIAHYNRRNMFCHEDKAREQWVTEQPKTEQERADTWAWTHDGEPSWSVKVPVNGRAVHGPIEIDEADDSGTESGWFIVDRPKEMDAGGSSEHPIDVDAVQTPGSEYDSGVSVTSVEAKADGSSENLLEIDDPWANELEYDESICDQAQKWNDDGSLGNFSFS